jgi:fructose-1,6-bisphosphatase/inositol monophosphatase family enzyme
VIRATVREAFPGDAILTEEGVDGGARLSNRRCWIADPLDGTSHFIAGSDDFDTFVALAVDGDPVVAVALQLATGLLLGAVAGQGVWMQAGDGPRRHLMLSAGTPCRLATKAWLGAPGNVTALEAVPSALAAGCSSPSSSSAPAASCPRTRPSTR